MKRLKHTIPWLFMLLCAQTYGQSYFYYYQGEQVSLQRNLQKIAISVEGQSNAAAMQSYFSGSSTETLSDLTPLTSRNTVTPVDPERQSIETFYAEVTFSSALSESEYDNKLQEYQNSLAGVVSVMPEFVNAEGGHLNITNNFCVHLFDESDASALMEQAQNINAEVLGSTGYDGLLYIVSCNSGTSMNPLDAANAFHESGLFDYAEPEAMIKGEVNLLPNDPEFSNGTQWGLRNTGQNSGVSGMDINVELAWDITTGAGVNIGMYDGGVDNPSGEFSNRFNGGFDIVSWQGPALRHKHGGITSGVAVANQNNNTGISGVAPGSLIKEITVNFDVSQTSTNWAEGFNYAASNGVDVLNCSWKLGGASNTINNAITNCLTNGRGGNGTVIVFSSGNNNESNSTYPANSNTSLLVVGAMDRCGIRAGNSGSSPTPCDPWPGNGASGFGTPLDVMAPGTEIKTTDWSGNGGYVNGDFTSENGTSLSAPFVSGIAALMLSVAPDLTRQQVTDIIEQTARKVRTDAHTYNTDQAHPSGTWSDKAGYGLVDAHAAVLGALAQSCQANVNITVNVPAQVTARQQASNTITATNTINANAIANYHAANEVRLSPGFSAVLNSELHVYAAGCTNTYTKEGETADNSLPGNTAAGNKQVTKDKEISGEALKTKEVAANNALSVYPNPGNGHFNVMTGTSNKKDIRVYDTLGKLAFEKLGIRNPRTAIDLTGHPKGVYMVQITENNTIQTKRIILN